MKKRVEADTVSIITRLPHEEGSIEALIIKVDALFRGDKGRYQLLFIAPKVLPLASKVIVNKQTNEFPVDIVNDELIRNLQTNTCVYLRDVLATNLTVLPALSHEASISRKNVISVSGNTSYRQKTKRFISGLLRIDPLEQQRRSFDASTIIVFNKKALNGDDISFTMLSASPSSVIIRNLGFHSVKHIHLSHFERQIVQQSSGNGGSTQNSKFKEFSKVEREQRGNGFYYKGHEYVTHNSLERKSTAVERTSGYQRYFILIGLLLMVALAVFFGHILVVAVVTIVTLLYAVDLLFNMFLIYRSYRDYSEITIADESTQVDRNWPSYTILCPLYKEVAVVPQFVSAMRALEYPRDALEVMLLLEEDDTGTISAISSLNLPSFFTVVVVPHSMPKTKPKACNYGLLQAEGEYTVIYDAEDIPEPLQLKKAVLAFENSSDDIACIQAKLNYYNWNQNLLTRLFTLEYSLWFNLVLTGLQSIKAPIPLGGTSNHFKVTLLRQLGGWDPFNVTEDADLGIRIAKRGMKTAILDSTTLEEANSQFGNWLKQRSRWIKGYMQTYLVHMRDLREFGRNSRFSDIFTFQLTIGGKIVSMLVNPLLWLMTILYFALRPVTGDFIESLYLAPVFYIGATSLILGNFLYLYYYMMGAARENRPELIIFALFVPVYWLMMSIAALMALSDLIVRPFHWHKTKHGLHLKKTDKVTI